VKRGLITWDRAEIPPNVFERRMGEARAVLKRNGLDALVVYSDLWRSNHARYFANYMPYFNRALLIVPTEGKPTLLCGLSPRTYRWIQSVTPIEDVRSAGNFLKPLAEIAAERKWQRIGVLDAAQLPYDLAKTLRSGNLEFITVESADVVAFAEDDVEIAMRRKAVSMARYVLESSLTQGVGQSDYAFSGILEGRLRGDGAEDVVLLCSNGDGPPAPARGLTLGSAFSVSLALEYRGHWARVTRGLGGEALSRAWDAQLETLRNGAEAIQGEQMGGVYPYAWGTGDAVMAFHVEALHNGNRVFFGDTFLRTAGGWKLL